MPPPRGFLNETLPGQPAPSWMEATLQPPPERSRLTGEISVDVGIVGAGYAGLSAALTLAERGVSVAVLEAHRVGWGASGRNGGHLDSLPRREIAFFERTMGVEDARAIVHAARDAAKLVRRRIREHAIDCDLTDGAVEVHHRRRFDAEAEDAVATLAERYGIGGLEFLPPARLTDWVRAEGLFGGVLHRESGSLNPLAYARGLARAAEAAGAQIFERSRVAVVEPGTVALTEGAAPHPRTRARLVTAEGSVSADRVILCLGGYHDGLAPDYAARVAPLRAFQIATEPLGDRLRDLMPGGVPVSDSRFVINCFRPTPDGRLLFGGGETSRPRGPGDIAERVRRRMTRLFPSLADIRIDHAWAGTLGISLNRAPVFRRIAPRLLAIGGWSGSGVHMASLGGEIAAEAILGEPERFELMARIPSPAYPARGRLRRPSMAAALAFGALKDRLG